jgi:hypothetical protein
MPLDLLSKIRREIDERLEQLWPLLAEHERLLEAEGALERADAAIVAMDAIERGVVLSEQTDGAHIEAQGAKVTASTKSSPPGPRAVRRGADGTARPKSASATRSAAGTTILAALEHGSHTVGELAVVTALSGPTINANLRKLFAEKAVVKTEREGKAAWALAAA